MNHPEPAPLSASAAFAGDLGGERLVSLTAGTLALTWVADFLFWKSSPGISVGIFALLLAGAVLSRPKPGASPALPWPAFPLLGLACLESAVEVSLSNVLVISTLLLFLVGRIWFTVPGSVWSQISEAAFAILRAPARWPWLCGALSRSELVHVGLNTVTADRAARSIQILAPGAALGVVFMVLFSFGNAIFADILQRGSQLLITWLFDFDFSISRLLLWSVVGSVALAVLHPPAMAVHRWWRRALPRYERADARVAIWQSAVVLVMLNGIFFFVNTIDVVFLWMNAAPPVEVSFSAYVHRGVYSLIAAVLLSAVVLAALFQQSRMVTESHPLKVLALAWVIQNLLLLAAVGFRLKLYVDAYDLSELRVYVGCFLLLVGCGFILLARHILLLGELHRLIWQNAVAAFTLFFVLQFYDVGSWVARKNFARWEADPSRALDVTYLSTLRSGAWPTLVALAVQSRSPALAADAVSHLNRLAAVEQERRLRADWRAWQARRDLRSRWLIAEADRLASVASP